MATADPDAEPIISREAAIRAAERTVARAFATEFSIDPLIGRDLSRSFSVVNSVVQRHGPLIARTLADTLRATGRFDVFTEMIVPIPPAADDLVVWRNSPTAPVRIRSRADSCSARPVAVDLVAVDRASGWAGAYDIKRGGGATEWRRRRPVEHDLLALRLVLDLHLAQSGFEIGQVTTGVIDWIGSSGFNRGITLCRDDLNEHFGVPVVGPIDLMTTALKRALHARLRSLIEPAMQKLPTEQWPESAIERGNVTSILRAPRKSGEMRLRSTHSGGLGTRRD
jgi:hypothetical protein